MQNSYIELSDDQIENLLTVLEARFKKQQQRHPGIDWDKVSVKLNASPEKMWTLSEMERTGGEPDVVGTDAEGNFIFMDCSAETPKGRRSVCYDLEGLESRKEHKPDHNAIDMAADMGVSILNEMQYRDLQQFGPFDTKTSSWIDTPADIRALGGALFADHRYGKIFIYHNGAQSYYAVRGFRAMLTV